MTKTLMILGADNGSIPLICASKKEGLRTVVCDKPENCHKHSPADVFYPIATDDYDKLIAIARQERINGVVSLSDHAMGAVARIAEDLKLVGNSPASVELLQNKILFRQLETQCGLLSPQCKGSQSYDQFLIDARTMSCPFLIKANQSCGCRGLTKIERWDESTVRMAFEKASSFSSDSLVLAEEFIDRPNLTNIECDLFIHNNEIIWAGYETNFCIPAYPNLPAGGCFPAFLSEEHQSQFENAIRKLLVQAGIRHGAYNAEAYFTKDNQLFVIEINARMAGATVPEIVEKHYGISLYRLLITTAMGDDSYFYEVLHADHPKKYITNFILFSIRDGIFSSVFIHPDIKKYVLSIRPYVPFGTTVKERGDASGSLGVVYLEFPTQEEQLRVLAHIDQVIHPIIL